MGKCPNLAIAKATMLVIMSRQNSKNKKILKMSHLNFKYFTSRGMLAILIFILITSCGNDKEMNTMIKDLIKLEEITKDSTDKAMQDNTELVSDYGGNESGANASGNTRMTMYVTKKDKIYVAVQNVTGNYLSGFEAWNEGYELEYTNLTAINDDKGIGFAASIDKSEKETRDITYNIKFLYKDSSMYVTFFGGPENMKWQQWDYFHFKNPEQARSIITAINSKIK